MKKIYAVLAAAAVLVVALSLVFVPESAKPVQAAIITPVSQTARGAEGARTANYFTRQVVTADSRVCFDLSGYETLDVQFDLDTNLSNPTTITLQQTNIDPAVGPFNSANVLATVPPTPADANGMAQVPLFGRWNCYLVDVTNANPVTVTIIGVAK